MEPIDIYTPIGQLAVANPAHVHLFEHFGLDYCCAGTESLDEACRTAGIDVEVVLAQLTADAPAECAAADDPAALGLAELADHIERQHHFYLRAMLPRLGDMIDKVAHVHGDSYSWLYDLKQAFHGLRADLEMHMLKEESILFPLMRELEAAVELPSFDCGSIANPIAAMEHEHEHASKALRSLRRLSDNFALPRGACQTFRGLMVGLAELEEDLHQHIHKENNILFTRASEAEQRLRGAAG